MIEVTTQEKATDAVQENQVIRIIANDRTYLLKPEVLYYFLKPLIDALLKGGIANADTPEQKQVAKLFTVGIKGVFVVAGPALLKSIFQTNDHPRPGKGDDILAWYSNILTMVAVKHITTQDIRLQVEGEGNNYEIIGYTSESLPVAAQE